MLKTLTIMNYDWYFYDVLMIYMLIMIIIVIISKLQIWDVCMMLINDDNLYGIQVANMSFYLLTVLLLRWYSPICIHG